MRWSQRKMGWIGVDVGTSTVNVAQVERGKHGWGIAASAVVPRHEAWLTKSTDGNQYHSSLDELQAAISLQRGYRGRSVVAALPMAICDLHRLDVDLSREANAQRILRQTIETATQQSMEHLQYDYWSAPAADPQPAWSQALTISRGWTDQLCEDIARVGWDCEAIDGLPLTIARAVNMVHPGKSDEPVAALDWGNGRATLCFIEAGQPTYVRCLKHCGLSNMLSAIVETLQVSELEAQRLLEDYGTGQVSQDAGSETASDIAHLVREVISESLHNVIEEINRSFSHFQYVRRAASPQQLYVLGGGGMIKGLDQYLSNHLEVKTQNWQLPAQGDSRTSSEKRADCLLASAIGLSALAWEVS